MSITSASSPIEVVAPAYELVSDERPVREAAAAMLLIARNGGSILTDHDVWTVENLDVLMANFVHRPDVSGASFFEKLEKQLAGVNDDVRVLFAELLILQMLPITQFKVETKVGIVQRALEGTKGDFTLPPMIMEAFGSPIFNGGQGFATRRYFQLSVMIQFFRYLQTLPEESVAQAFTEPLAWKQVVMEAPGSPSPSLRASLTYLCHPEYFFPIVSISHKKQIIDAFYPAVTKKSRPKDIDVAFAELRSWLDPEVGTTPNFYAPELSDYWIKDEVVDAEPLPVDLDVDVAEYTVETIISEGSFHDPEQLRSIIARWEETRNVILQGSPGTGKTWLARRLAFALIGSKIDEAVRAVQFHPGTSYEDFVRGWRPGGDGKLMLVDGPLLQHARRARENPDIPHVMIIEEFNRGNPAQALGEMLTLIERSKRSEEDALELTYMREGEENFHLPENLFIIGTMNTADRSLALVDFALRRRFAFFELEPQLGTAWKGHLAQQFRTASSAQIDDIAARVNALNDTISADLTLGSAFRIGHSYFTAGQETTELVPWFRSVINSSVGPQLREYWNEDDSKVETEVGQLLTGL